MNKDFNVYKWRRERLIEADYSREVNAGEFRDERSTQTKPMYDPETGRDNVTKEYDGGLRIRTRSGYLGGSKDSYDMFGEDAKKMIEDKGYTFVGVSSVDFDMGGRIHMYHDFYYLKPKSVDIDQTSIGQSQMS
jgi:hypothetical protein